MFSGPGPLRHLVEDNVVADVDAPGRRIVGAIRLGARLVPDEDHAPAAVIQLPQIWRGHLDVGDAPECAEVMHPRRASCPELVRRLSSSGFARRPI